MRLALPVFFLSLLLQTGCASPTLPLPPPAALTASPPDPATGLVTVTGLAQPEAWVYCINLDTDRGVIQRALLDGSFQIEIAAASGHYLSLFQETGIDRGSPMEIRVP